MAETLQFGPHQITMHMECDPERDPLHFQTLCLALCTTLLDGRQREISLSVSAHGVLALSGRFFLLPEGNSHG